MGANQGEDAEDFESQSFAILGKRKEDQVIRIMGVKFLIGDTGNAGPALGLLSGDMDLVDDVIRVYVKKPSRKTVDDLLRPGRMSTPAKIALVKEILNHFEVPKGDFPGELKTPGSEAGSLPTSTSSTTPPTSGATPA